ncbi:MAG: hypothetical protein ACTHMS_04865 [Jatrophihabitans sp.]|uniref:hypothetical protein n=1 Tax=Jatrophihabitans sp. TaxID=1932789 RepID=UPI003F7FB0E9
MFDRDLDFVAGRCRPNTVLATAYDLKVFFTVVAKDRRRLLPIVAQTKHLAVGDDRSAASGMRVRVFGREILGPPGHGSPSDRCR